MPDILDIIDKNATPEEQMDSIRKNFTMVSRTNLKAGTYSLFSATIKTAQAITSASYVDLTGLTGSFNSSGGLVTFQGSIFAALNTANGAFALVLDDSEVAWATVGVNNTAIGVHLPIFYSASLNAGSHKWKIRGKVTAGTFTVGYDTTTSTGSTFSITESLRG